MTYAFSVLYIIFITRTANFVQVEALISNFENKVCHLSTSCGCDHSIAAEHFVVIHTVLFVKISLSWDLKHGKCLVSIYITQIASFHGWSSTIPAQFVAMSCHLRALLVTPAVVGAVKIKALVLETVGITIIPQIGKMLEKVKEGEIYSPFCGLFAPRALVQLLTGMNQEEAVLLLFMKILTRSIILDGPLIIEIY